MTTGFGSESPLKKLRHHAVRYPAAVVCHSDPHATPLLAAPLPPRAHLGMNRSTFGHGLHRIQQKIGKSLAQLPSVDADVVGARGAGLDHNARRLKPLFKEIEHRSQQFSYVSSFWHGKNFMLTERFACDLGDPTNFLLRQSQVVPT